MTEIEQLQAQKAKLGKQVALRDQILKLTSNPEFEAVILKEWFQSDAARCIRIGGDPGLNKEQREDAIQMALATGHLQRFLSANIQMGNAAESDIHQIDETLEELRSEGGE